MLKRPNERFYLISKVGSYDTKAIECANETKNEMDLVFENS